ncbi:5-oxoprolinase subunit PxpB [Ureibacillus sp. GCM10028918]
MMWISQHTIRFAFNEEISQQSFLAVQQFNTFICKKLHHSIMESVPSYYTVTVFLKKRPSLNYETLVEQWRLYQTARMNEQPSIRRELSIPICYDEEFALDMERVMEVTHLSYDEIISSHISKPYSVHLVGFLPGFPYLGELDQPLHVPRLEKPRKLVEASSVGIGGYQTGIYPIDSPGGWNIIGKTPYTLFDVTQDEPTLFQVGDRVTFYEITKQEFYKFVQEKACCK